MKLNIIGVLVALVIYTVNCSIIKTVDLGEHGNQNMKLNYLDNPGSALTSIEFAAHIRNGLKFDQTVTNICFKRKENEEDIKEGDHGFGIMFACYLKDGCDNGIRLSSWLFASHLESLNPPTWSSDGQDYSHLNTGILYGGNKTDFDTTYMLGSNDAISLTIPPSSADSEWRCYFKSHGIEPYTRLDNRINLSDWTTSATWNTCVPNSTEENCETNHHHGHSHMKNILNQIKEELDEIKEMINELINEINSNDNSIEDLPGNN